MRYDALIAALLLLGGTSASYAAAMGLPSSDLNAAVGRARADLIATAIVKDLRLARRLLGDLDEPSAEDGFESDDLAVSSLSIRADAAPADEIARRAADEAFGWLDLLHRARAKTIAPRRPGRKTGESPRSAKGSLEIIEIAKRAKETKSTSK